MADFRSILMGSKGSATFLDEPIGANTGNPFRSKEGWDEYARRMRLLHGMATTGQREGIMREVQAWEARQLVGLEQLEEYHDIMRAQEIFEQLTKEGNDR